MDPMTIASLVSAGGGLLGGLFAKKAPRNPFAPEINNQTAALGDLSNKYAGMADTAQAGADRYRPQFYGAIDAEADTLKANPFTDSYSSRALGNATAGTNAAYDAARSRLAQSTAARGLSGDSSVSDGGMAAIESGRAGEISGAQNSLAQAAIAQRASNQARLTALYGGITDASQANQNDALGRGGAIHSGLLASYTGRNNEANAYNQADYAQQLGGINSAAGALGTIAGGVSRAKNPFADGDGPDTAADVGQRSVLQNGFTRFLDTRRMTPQFNPYTQGGI